MTATGDVSLGAADMSALPGAAAALRGRADGVRHVRSLPGRRGEPAAWPAWAPEPLIARFRAAGIAAPWRHQVTAAELAHAGRSVIVATGTASGKSLAYQLPVLTALVATAADLRPARALYLAPTKALAADQLRVLDQLAAPGVRAAGCDGDTPHEERDWVRRHANLVLSNPDMLHRAMLPAHARWATFFRGLRYVVVDECHGYRGVFGSHVAQVLRRLRRVCEHYGSTPTFILASATTADPAGTASRLIGGPVACVTDDAAPRGASTFVLFEPPLQVGDALEVGDGLGLGDGPTATSSEQGGPVRRPAATVAAEMLADLVTAGARTVVFVRSRRGAETVALAARRRLAERVPQLVDRVAAYRGGYLADERRLLERRLHSGALLGVAATNALELGIDVAGLDAVVLVGYPGTLASLWQQAGRAGRTGRGGLTVFVARDEPLDSYLVRHPEAVFDRPVEATVLDPTNPYVLAPQLCAAAAELPLTERDLTLFGGGARDLLPELERRELLRRRPTGWYWLHRERGCDLADLRGTGAPPVQVVEAGTGRLLGSCDGEAAHTTLHTGAVHLHQGECYLVERLDVGQGVAVVVAGDPGYTTVAREESDLAIVDAEVRREAGPVQLAFGTVDVTRQVVSYLRRRTGSGEVLGEHPLDLPARRLRTKAVWWTVDGAAAAAALPPRAFAGAAHAAEHASIGLLPLFATCDRWDIGGLSTARHPDTGRLTVFVYDGQPGGAGFAERGFSAGAAWLAATRDAVAGCGCRRGCPSCVHSPKCGNGNEPLDKCGAHILLSLVAAALSPAGHVG